MVRQYRVSPEKLKKRERLLQTLDQRDAENLVALVIAYIVAHPGTVHLRGGKYVSVSVSVPLHRALLNPRDGMEVDHINGDRFDNRRANLRLVTSAQNKWNVKRRSPGASRFRGVCRHRARKNEKVIRWQANIKVNKQLVRLGYFRDEEQAARAYDVAAKKYHGEFATLNFPEDK